MRRPLGPTRLQHLFQWLGTGSGRHVRAAPGEDDPARPRYWRFCRQSRPLARLTAARPIPFEELRAAASQHVALVGHLYYEAGAALDPASAHLVRADSPGLDVDAVAVFVEWDAETGEAVLCADDDAACAAERERLMNLRSRPQADEAVSAAARSAAAPLRAMSSRSKYEDDVRETVRRIRAGDLFQANLARHYESSAEKTTGDPLDLFRALIDRGAAPYAAFSQFDDRAVLSNTPELFLEVKDGLVRTRPIKGTTARLDDPEADRAAADLLHDNPKDRAENMMIVDLMRNDLARVCTDDSVKVTSACRLETYPAVHHLVSEVSGRLRAGLDMFDALAAAFPPGSITGAPKWAAMALIDRLEARPRGAFCGSSFWIEGPQDGVFTVAIRTAEWRRDGAGARLVSAAGAGVTAASDPCAERRETEQKMRALDALFS